MKLENTPENKDKFIALYWGQPVFRHDLSRYNGIVSTESLDIRWVNPQYSYLELIPLSQITDEDAIEVAKLYGWNLSKPYVTIENQIKSIKNKLELFSERTINIIWSVYMYLISKGYYVGDGTEIEFGWVKLKISEL